MNSTFWSLPHFFKMAKQIRTSISTVLLGTCTRRTFVVGHVVAVSCAGCGVIPLVLLWCGVFVRLLLTASSVGLFAGVLCFLACVIATSCAIVLVCCWRVSCHRQCCGMCVVGDLGVVCRVCIVCCVLYVVRCVCCVSICLV